MARPVSEFEQRSSVACCPPSGYVVMCCQASSHDGKQNDYSVNRHNPSQTRMKSWKSTNAVDERDCLIERLLFALGCHRLGRILDLTWFVVCLSSVSSMFPLVLRVEFRDVTCFSQYPSSPFGPCMDISPVAGVLVR